MNAQEIMNSEDFKRCAAFHGHVCPGLSIGYRVRDDYVRLLRETLAQSALRKDVFPDLDLGSLESLIAALNSADDHEVLAALSLLEERGRANLVPALILYHAAGRESNFGAVQVAAKAHPFAIERAQCSQTEDLVAAAIGENRPAPAREGM